MYVYMYVYINIYIYIYILSADSFLVNSVSGKVIHLSVTRFGLLNLLYTR